jgi:uncharacterized protein (DUF1697 family)
VTRRATTSYVALLRGINVGGNNVIKMTDLAACFEAQGLVDVRTYIQSGNVLFAAAATDQARLTRKLERALSSTFGYEASLVLRSRKQLEAVVAEAPAGFGARPQQRRYDVLFLKEPLTSAAALQDLPLKEGVDEAAAGPGVVYFSRLVARASQSRLSRVVSLPIYKSLTVRNWNTTTKLVALLSAR